MWQQKKYGFRAALYQFIWIIATLWIIEFVDQLYFEDRLGYLGIHPGNWSHWEGIFFAPLLHGNWAHLIGNSIGLLTLGSIILLRGWRDLATVSFLAIIMGGLVTMIFGSVNSYHIGASGVVYGYFGFLISIGFVERSIPAIVTTILVVATHWSMTQTMFPNEITKLANISWEGHLGGAIGGFIAAKNVARRRR